MLGYAGVVAARSKNNGINPSNLASPKKEVHKIRFVYPTDSE